MFMGEYMCGVSYDNAVFSGLTMAWMADSGWYFPQTSTAETLRYGRNLGCTFANPLSCPSRGSLGTPFYACTSGQTGCTFDRSGQGACSGLNDDFLFNSCSYYSVYSNRHCRFGTKWFPSTNDGSTVGLNSLCFRASLLGESTDAGTNTANCYEYQCFSRDQLYVKVNGVLTACPYGSTVTVSGYGGSLTCPSAVEGWCSDLPATPVTLPRITTVSPTSGDSGSTISLTGTGFANVTAVYICDTAGSSLAVTATTISVVNEASNSGISTKRCNIYIVDNQGRKFAAPESYDIDAGVGDLIDSAWWNCAIATAAYGSPMDPHVWALRNFRDQYLKQTVAGQTFIDFYYRYSPSVAKVIANNDWMKPIVRMMLWPIVSVVEMF